MSQRYRLGGGKWVFIDWTGIFAGYGTDPGGRPLERGFLAPHGLALRTHKPRIEPLPVLQPDRPWESRGLQVFATFLQDQGRFRCWYGVPLKGDAALGYAESDDGVNWTKPLLGLKTAGDAQDTNLVGLTSRGGVEQAHHVFIDPTAPAAERYKMVSCCDEKDGFALYGAVSSDGLRWTHLPDDTPILKNRSDTHSIGAFNEALGKYIIYTRQRDNTTSRRGVNRSESSDFRAFPPSEAVLESSPLDPPDWDYYNSGYSRWPGTIDAHLMRFAVYHRMEDTVDVHLAVSRDEKIWHRPMGRTAWADGGPSDPPYKCVYGCSGILPTAPGEWSTYLGVSPHGHNEKGPRRSPCLLRAVSREDGFMSLYSKGPGEFWTIPFPLNADSIRLNVRTGASGFVRCAILAAALGEPDTVATERHPVPVFRGFTMNDCVPVRGDHVDMPLTWKGDLRALRGKEIQLHVDLFNADLYAVNFI